MMPLQETPQNVPATYGGQGWQPRGATLAAEIAAGIVWRRCGYNSESGVLREVLVSWPGEEINFAGPPDRYLMLEKPDLANLQQQTTALIACYESQGITVHVVPSPRAPLPNFLFMRDLFWATPEGIILARPASQQRAGEERFAAEALLKVGAPIIMYPHGDAVFEGADALWLDPHTVLLGAGIRTNAEAVRQLAELLKSMAVTVIPIALPHGVQHLLGILNFAAEDLAVVNGGKVTNELRAALQQRHYSVLELPADDELVNGRGMNFVTLSPRRIIMPTRCPGITKRFEREGIEIIEVEVSEYLKAAGGPGCITGILSRT